MNDLVRSQRLADAIGRHADILQAIVLAARDKGQFPGTKWLETNLWPAYRDRLPRSDFRRICDDFGSLFTPPPKHIAISFDFEPLPHGNVLIRFFGDGTTPINEQIVSPDVVRRFPIVTALMDVTVQEGPEVAREIVERLNAEQSIEDV